jgi:branched-chain amino acid transport system substrate-binding protein
VLKEGYRCHRARPLAAGDQAQARPPRRHLPHRLQPDISLFLRQSRELGLRFSALVGHGAGYGVYDKLKESLGKDVILLQRRPISIWLANEKR